MIELDDLVVTPDGVARAGAGASVGVARVYVVVVSVTRARPGVLSVQVWELVDPKAGMNYAYSPYSSMNGNPITHSDPNGDVLPAIAVAAIVGAVVGGGGNLFYQWKNGNVDGFGSGLKAFGIGAIAGSVGAMAGTVAVMGGAAFTAAGTGAAVAGNVTVGGYALGSTGAVSGALSGAVGGVVSSPIRQVGNVLAGWQDDVSFKEIIAEGVIGGVTGGLIGGVGAKLRGENFWWGNSKYLSSLAGGVDANGLERVIDGRNTSEVLDQYGIKLAQKHIYKGRVGEYYNQMLDGTFDLGTASREMSMWSHNGVRTVTGGVHRITAAAGYGMRTGDYGILEQLINSARVTQAAPSLFNYQQFIWPSQWILK